MLKKAQKKHKKTNVTRPEVIELYKNNAFVSDSLSSTCLSSVKFSADGQMSTKTVGKLGDRHLQATLKLPELEERCAIPSNKDLYKLSQQLADDEVVNPPTEKTEEFQEPKAHKPQNNLARKRSVHVGTKDSKLNKIYNIVENSSVSPSYKSKVNTENSQQIDKKLNTLANETHMQIGQRKQKKTKRIRFENKKKSTYSSDECCYNTARSSQLSNQQHNQQTDKKAIQLMEHLAKLLPQEETKRKIKSQSKQLNHNYTLFKELIRIFKLMLQTIDDWHSFTLLLVLGTAAFLIYILCYDINIYVNEERRYVAKMRSSGIVLKCFYYVMRLLKVPIF